MEQDPGTYRCTCSQTLLYSIGLYLLGSYTVLCVADAGSGVQCFLPLHLDPKFGMKKNPNPGSGMEKNPDLGSGTWDNPRA
jgi:hypothetical protein